ncbi:DUF6443 domain-containing protein [Foetidibacter luteolus]|uniref:DUF6443 domain-containing protein n=1 Tax=Foetidibacter luteolus TaxID=2608880 RepID=UPI00129B4D7F|nr:DUF6443 domain-containing protein [Foetidibacter luteolus]
MNQGSVYWKKRIVICLFTINLFLVSKAQLKPTIETQTPNAAGTARPVPAAYGSTAGNYVRSWQALRPFATEAEVTGSSDVTRVSRSTQYFDGLGRLLQTVNWRNSPGQKDIVAPVVYDEFGREQYKYLPYGYASTNNAAAASDGSFKQSPFSDQAGFYGTTYKAEQPALANELFYYSHTNYEASPLDRVTENFAPGNSWAGSEGGASEKMISVQYLVNNSNDNVRIWTIGFTALNYASTDENASVNIPTSSAAYGTGQLYKTVTKDEKGKATVEYKDKEGRVILRKVEIGPNAIPADFSGHANFLCTYYVYDEMGQLRFVISPKAVAAMVSAGNWILASPLSNELCFRYEYDERQRLVAKKVPGAGWIYMAFDNRDRLVFSQDANMRAGTKKWLYTLYDNVNRPVETGVMTYNGTWDQVKTAALNNTPTTVAGTGSFISTTPADLYLTEREQGRPLYQASNSIEAHDGFTTEEGAEFTMEIVTASAGGSFNNSIDVSADPITGLTGETKYPLTYSFYDDYSKTSKTYSNSNNGSLNNTNSNAYAEALPSAKSSATKGLVTVSRVRVIEDPNNLSLGKWMETASFYDEKGRVIQVNSDNYKGGDDVITNLYDFTGKILCSYLVHNNASANISNIRIKTNTEYDHAGRLTKVIKTVTKGSITTSRTIVQNVYDAMGQLKTKNIGQKSATNTAAMETDNYAYNIRGWLKGVNWYNGATYGAVTNTTNKWFAMDLSYDWGFDGKEVNGNIAGQRWRSASDGKSRAYGYSYDVANRLMKADFTQYTGSAWNTSEGVDFSVIMGNTGADVASAYDENGNIKKMWQKGLLAGGGSNWIDKMSYAYEQTNQYSNKLTTVTEDATIGSTDYGLGDFTDKNRSGADYDYDDNGNLIVDKNKAISAIVYNHLNLPWKITVTNKGTITYIYDAAGNKLEKRTSETASAANNNTSKQTQTAYLSGFIYENNKLQHFGHEEGRVRPIVPTTENGNQSFAFDYFLKDHLGNIRTVLTEETNIQVYNMATMEPEAQAVEETYYSNLAETRTVAPQTYPQKDSSNKFLAKVDGKNRKVGPYIVLKVNAGDKVHIRANSWYEGKTYSKENPKSNIDGLAAGLLGDGARTAAKGASMASAGSSSALLPALSAFVRSRDEDEQAQPKRKPKAYLNWLLLDNNAKAIQEDTTINPLEKGEHSGFKQVGEEGEIKELVKQDWQIDQTGFVYIFTSNESLETEVFFDNLQVTVIPGPLLEETHYYPFGLTMAGISSKGAGKVGNKRKFNGVELSSKDFSDGVGLELYETTYRSYDPQIGRFHQIDALSDLVLNWSTYSFTQNNPIIFSDPFGLDTIRGELPKGYKPNPGDVWINDKGNEAVYNTDNGWVQSQTLQNVTVSNSPGSKLLAAFFALIGLTDTHYGFWESTYDHENYTTTKGKVRPLPTNIKHASVQAKMYKQRSNKIKGTGFGLSLLANLLTAIQVRDQYLKGGIKNVNPADVTGLTLGTTGLTANGLTYFGVAPQTMSTISGIAGKGSVALQAYQNWMMAMQIMYNTNLPNAPAYGGNATEQFQATLDDEAAGGDRLY